MQTYIVNFDVVNSKIGIAYPPGATVPATVAPFPIPPGVSPGIAPAPRKSNYGTKEIQKKISKIKKYY